MKRGRKPKPTALKKLEGNPGKRPLNENDPVFDPSIPTCPSWLDETARREWKRVAPLLYKKGLLTEADRAVLVGYVVAWTNLRKAFETIKADGQVREFQGFDRNGNIKPSKITKRPEMTIINESLNQIRFFCHEFGMTPSSRANMVVPGESDSDDPLEQLLRQSRNQ